MNPLLHLKLESYQDNAVLAITGAVKGSSREKFYQELGLETKQKRGWLRRCLFYKMQGNKSPSYLFMLMQTTKGMHITGNSNDLKGINVKHDFSKNPFFPSVIGEWDKLDPKIRDPNTLESFKEQILNL